jgi:hydrophobic/amphiphilic exporter-1 (mainly G- bacteria), HAE1 family
VKKKFPLTSFIAACLIPLIWGLLSYTQLPVRMYPSVVKPSADIWFGHSAYDENVPGLMQDIGLKIEANVRALDNVEDIRTDYSAQSNLMKITFEWGADEKKIKADLEKVFSRYNDSQNRYYYSIYMGGQRSQGQFIMAIFDPSLSGIELSKFSRDQILQGLKQIKGVASADIFGQSSDSLVFKVKWENLYRYKLHPQAVLTALQNVLMIQKLGNFKWANKGLDEINLSVAISSDKNSREKLMNSSLQLINQNNQQLSFKLQDILSLEKEENISDAFFDFNGVPAQFAQIFFTPDADMKKVAAVINKRLDDFQKMRPSLKIKVITNPLTFVKKSMNSLLINALMGSLLAIMVLWPFFGSWPPTLVVAASLPFCLISCFIAFSFFGITLNLISIGGLAIAVGMVIDSAIVSLENIDDYSKRYPKKDLWTCAFQGTKEIAFASSISVLTSLIVFIPILLTSSYTKAILGELTLAIIFTLTNGLITSLLIVPPLTAFALQKIPQVASSHHKKGKGPLPLRLYKKALHFFLTSKRGDLIIISLITFLIIAGIGSAVKLPRKMIDTSKSNIAVLNYNTTGNQSFDDVKKTIRSMQKDFQKLPYIEDILTMAWSREFGMQLIILKNNDDYEIFENLWKDKKKQYDNKIEFFLYRWDPGGLPLPRLFDAEVRFSGALFPPDLHPGKNPDIHKQWEELATKHALNLNINPKADYNSRVLLTPYRHIAPDLVETASGWMNFYPPNSYYLGRQYLFNQWHELTFAIKISKDTPASSLPFLYQNKIIPLAAVGKWSTETRPDLKLTTLNEQEVVLFTFTEGSPSPLSFKERYQNFWRDFDQTWPALKVRQEYLEHPEVTKSRDSFLTSLFLSILAITFLLLICLNSLPLTFVILTTIPLALAGACFGLWMASSSLSLNSMLGAIILAGLVVNNAILMIDTFRQSPLTLNSRERAFLAATRRFRPIMMTTLTTLLGLLPVALGLGEGGEVLQPLGVSLLSGLFFSTFLTLFVVPMLLKRISYGPLQDEASTMERSSSFAQEQNQ